MQQFSPDYWIDVLNLAPHPEGGYYKETYRCREKIERSALPGCFNVDCAISTAIYYLLKSGQRSLLHRLNSDEIWHFYYGGPLTIHIISPEGGHRTELLGNNPVAGETFQVLAPAGAWFGAYPARENDYALIGCTVAPGFEFIDFELADRDAMIKDFPQYREIIERLT